ncbi:MAG: molecular chaperone HtpG [Clostridiales bacterium]|jgi:molecular chaperone HtpG|nr:molecular chaperone HtpG [Clostridiales bacterium]
MEKGNLSIHSENILPIIKKWLYSDMDIFVRELVSNGADAITKLKKLADMGDAKLEPDEEFFVKVKVDKTNKQIIFDDNGIGMTADEIKEYINQIAFSGANAFIEKYKEKTDASSDIIGHFGLGFYSAFMVSERVQIDSLSYKKGAEATRWECEGGIEYEMHASPKTERGTTITLFIGESGEEFLEVYKLRSVLTKYCNFVPVPIYIEEIKEDEPPKDADDTDDGEETEKEPPKPINDTSPLWLKPANECTDEEYKAFYHKVFTDFNEPLFWIHLNMDYPFRLKGVLYFPKMKHDLEYIEGQVKLFNNQVFVADNIKEVIPEYLLLLKGVMDCPDLPLNVSRSFLQNDATVKKMSGYISRKVADKLNGLFKKDREQYNGYWDDIAPFIKYGCIKERELYDKIKGSVLYKTTEGKHQTLEEFLENIPLPEKTEEEKTPQKKTVYYVTNEQLQSQYIQMFKEQGLSAVLLATNLDTPFVNYLEMYEPEVKFTRIDSDITNELKDDDISVDDSQPEGLEARFREILKSEKLKVEVQHLKSSDISSVILLSEQSRRMQEMSKMFGGGASLPPGMFEDELTLVLNRNHSLVKTLIEIAPLTERSSDTELIASHLYDLAMLSHKPLPTEQMSSFIKRSNQILEMAAGKSN